MLTGAMLRLKPCRFGSSLIYIGSDVVQRAVLLAPNNNHHYYFEHHTTITDTNTVALSPSLSLRCRRRPRRRRCGPLRSFRLKCFYFKFFLYCVYNICMRIFPLSLSLALSHYICRMYIYTFCTFRVACLYVFIERRECAAVNNITTALPVNARGVATAPQLVRTFCHIMIFGSLN